MKVKIFLPFISLILFVCSCSKSDEDTQASIPPEAVDLIFPENNSECNEGEIINDEESIVTFQWNTSLNTDFYTFLLKGLNSDFIYEAETEETELAVTIKRGEAYSWNIISGSSGSNATSSSETWYFYNSGPGIIAHVPFPAEILHPKPGDILSSETGRVILEWSGSDLDEDIIGYEVYFGQENPPTNQSIVDMKTTLEVSVTSGNSYFWFLITKDEKNNSSNTPVVTFKME